MSLRNILINVLRGRILPFFTRMRLSMSPSYLWARVTELIRNFLQKILDVKPRNKDDYYPVARWLVSKRLAYAITIIIGVLCIIYISSSRAALFPGRGEANIKTYKYNNILLKFAKGKVRIKGKSGYLAYEGDVANSACEGNGTLMNRNGVVVYEGAFSASKYEGSGKQYFENGVLHYTGNFHENLYDGEGTLYRSSGSKEYEGNFARNLKEGEGTLYSPSGDAVYAGSFSHDEVLYASMIGKTAAEMAECYTGSRKLYAEGNERVRLLEDISAMTEEILDDNSIDEEAKVQAVYVLSDRIALGDYECKTYGELSEALGEPTYVGDSYATLPELLAVNRLNDASEVNVLNGPAEITENDRYTEYIQVDDYQDDYLVYLHSYQKDGLVYNFVSAEGDGGFDFYYILSGTGEES